MTRARLLFGFAASVLSTACASDPPPAPPPPRAAWGPDVAWIRSEKLDPDAQEFVLRAHAEDLPFAFNVSFAAPLDSTAMARARALGVAFSEPAGENTLVRAKPAALRVLVGDDRVRSIKCAARAFEPASGDEWRVKVDADVRTVVAAQSSCWTAVVIRFATDADAAVRRELESFGAEVHAFDAKLAIAWVPVLSVPHLAGLPIVGRIEPRPAPPER